jgi:hypothetical protein
MRTELPIPRRRLRPAIALLTLSFALLLFPLAGSAASWSGIEPLKSKRADVERILGTPLGEPTPDGALRFKVSGGTVSVYFVGSRFVTTKKLYPSLEGTVLEVVLQHENSTDTPESLGLAEKKGFERENGTNSAVFRNLKEGVTYTFLEGKLKTTRYTAGSEQLARARKG